MNIIGAGRLGKNIALALSAAGIANLTAVCNSSPESAKEAIKALGSGVAIDSVNQLPEADITWITSNDDSISSIVQQLVKYQRLKPGSLVFHCSGVLNSSLLLPLKSMDCYIASIHPLKAFATDYLSASAFNQVHCVIEGDMEAKRWLNNSFTSLGSQVLEIEACAKTTYHAAACMASNYLITLAACSEELLLEAGLEQAQAREMTCNLMLGNINNLQQTKHITDSLTGPLMRGDHRTIALHLNAIKNPVIQRVYQSAGIATLPLTTLDTKQQKDILDLLSAEDN